MASGIFIGTIIDQSGSCKIMEVGSTCMYVCFFFFGIWSYNKCEFFAMFNVKQLGLGELKLISIIMLLANQYVIVPKIIHMSSTPIWFNT